MDLNKISKHCYYTDYDKERDRPTLGYIYGDKYSLIVDVGASQFHVAEYNDLLKEEG